MSWFKRTINRLYHGESNNKSSYSIQNFRLIWLDSNIDVINNNYCIDTMIKLEEIANTVEIFTDVDECIDFITDLNDHDQTVMILSGSLGEIVMSAIHDISQINLFYIFCQNKERHKRWAREWSKIEAVITDVKSLCEAIKKANKDFDQNSIPISVVNATIEISTKDLDHLDPSFMYTQILKEILLDIDFNDNDIKEFLTYYRDESFDGDMKIRNYVDEIEKNYHQHEPIYWYTCQSFLYSDLNQALRTMNVIKIIRMGFFVRDLCEDIAALHSKQYSQYHNSNTILFVYRGQKLSLIDLAKIQNTSGGLLSFNNFLSTSTKREMASEFARKKPDKFDVVNVLYVIQINTSIKSSIPFANIRDISYFSKEEEILFSMHSIFRIGQINRIDTYDKPLWEVHLTLTNDNDEELHRLTDCIRQETFTTEKGWYRLGNFLNTLGEFTRAEEVCFMMLNQTNDQTEIASIYHLLGMIKYGQGNYQEAIKAYKTSIQMKKKIFPSADLSLASSYTNIGEVYNIIGKYSKAFSFHTDALKIKQKCLSSHKPDLALSYDNIGSTLNNMSVYSQAILYYRKALDIRQKSLPETHSDLSQSYHNIGSVYYRMGQYSKALLNLEKAIEIKQKTLPEKHISLASSYKNMGAVYECLQQYSDAQSFYERAYDISDGALLTNHPSLRTLQKDINRVNKKNANHFV
ncbi:hypothetical protein I4U23_019939 [Adineta vaga]|nr:hypothetical protein I4U23_019939 [Adineta vaga]